MSLHTLIMRVFLMTISFLLSLLLIFQENGQAKIGLCVWCLWINRARFCFQEELLWTCEILFSANRKIFRILHWPVDWSHASVCWQETDKVKLKDKYHKWHPWRKTCIICRTDLINFYVSIKLLRMREMVSAADPQKLSLLSDPLRHKSSLWNCRLKFIVLHYYIRPQNISNP